MFSINNFTITFNNDYVWLFNKLNEQVYYSKLVIPTFALNIEYPYYGNWFKYCDTHEVKDFLKDSISKKKVSVYEKDFEFGPEFCISINCGTDTLFLPLNKEEVFKPFVTEFNQLKKTNKRLREVNDDLTVQNKKLKSFDMDDNLILSFESEIERLIKENKLLKYEYETLEDIDNKVIEDLIKENNLLKNKIDDLNQTVDDLNDFITSIEDDINQIRM